MLTYKLNNFGGVNRSDGAIIPPSNDNRDWREYQEWLAEGNTPEPQYTPEEEAQRIIDTEVSQLRQDLRSVLTGQFEMMLELFKLLKQFTACTNADVDPDILTKAQKWMAKLSRLKELGDVE